VAFDPQNPNNLICLAMEHGDSLDPLHGGRAAAYIARRCRHNVKKLGEHGLPKASTTHWPGGGSQFSIRVYAVSRLRGAAFIAPRRGDLGIWYTAAMDISHRRTLVLHALIVDPQDANRSTWAYVDFFKPLTAAALQQN